MNEFKFLLIKIVLLLIFLAFSIGIEQVYREPLFNRSLFWEEEWQKRASASETKFFKIITNFGEGEVLIPIFAFCYLWLPINKSYIMMSAMLYSYYWDNLLKIVYGNPRPYWIRKSLFTQCNGGFGNPSGHSFSSTCFYLSFWHVMTDFKFFKDKTIGIIIRIVLLVLSICLALTIMISRLHVGAHSVNQILYGGSLGAISYYILFFVLSLNSMSTEKFFELFTKCSYNISFAIWYLILIIAGFLCWGLIDNNVQKWDEIINEYCPGYPEYRKFNADGLFQILSIFGMLGGHYGLTFLFLMTRKKYAGSKEEILHWNSGKFSNNFYKIFICILLGSPLIMTFVISGNASLEVIFIFKVSVPYLIGMFNIYGPAILILIKAQKANPKILIKPTLEEKKKENSVNSQNELIKSDPVIEVQII